MSSQHNAGGILGMFDMFSGGALGRMTIFALNIMPYISASIIIQLLTAVSPTLEALKKEGESGRKKINQYTRYSTVVLAAVQAYGIAVGLEGMRSGAQSAVIDPGMFFRVVTMVTLTGGTVFLMWLGEQITARGVGNGISLIIFAGHRRQPAACAGRDPGAGPHRRAVAGVHPVVPGDVDLRRRLHRLHGARAAAHPGAISEAPGRQPHVRRRGLASAAEDQHLGRHPADLRLVAAAAAGDDFELSVAGPGFRLDRHDHGVSGARPARST